MASRDFALVRPPRLASRSCVSRAGKRGGARGREGEPERRSLLFSAAGVGVGGDGDLFSPGREKKLRQRKTKQAVDAMFSFQDRIRVLVEVWFLFFFRFIVEVRYKMIYEKY